MLEFSAYGGKNEALHRALAAFLLLALSATVLSALAIQYIGGQIPCKLCLEERVPYYIGAPLMLIALLMAKKLPVFLIRLLFVIVCALMLYNGGLSIYHAGAEWKFWPGPNDCTTAAAIVIDNAANLLNSLDLARPVSCDEASLYFMGLSLAGWNAVASLFFALVAGIGAFCKIKR